MNTYTSAQILEAVNAQILEEIQMGADENYQKLFADVFHRFLVKLGEE